MKNAPSKYRLYEETVQSPRWQVDYLPQFHRWLTGKTPLRFREDFCGSARISCEWVKKSPRHSALAIDIDQAVLNYARTVNLTSLSSHEQKRLKILKQDVRKPTKNKIDMIGAFNFSFYDFHERKDLIRYFKSCLKSLRSRGTLFLEIGGGEGFIEPYHDQKKVSVPGVGSVTRIWEQHQFDPITSVCDYSIHFRLPDGSTIADAFHYHWRIWSIRELREALADAGFEKSIVLWDPDGASSERSGEFLPVEAAERHHSWVAYVVGVK